MTKDTSPALRRDHAGWIYVHLGGSPYERGLQHGKLLAKEIAAVIRTAEYLAKWDTGEDFHTFAKAAEEQFIPRMDEELSEELRGISKGADVPYPVLLAWNGYMDLLASWWPSHVAHERPHLGTKPWKGRRGHHCSAFIATGAFTRDGKIVVAHNSWDRYAAGDAFNVIFDVAPREGQRMLMQGVPGYIASTTDFWINSAGLLITETTIANFAGYDPHGAPEFYRSRRASQYATNIDDWCKLFAESNNGGYANSWLLGDSKTGEIARIELGLHGAALEKTRSGFFAGFNTASDLRLRNQECIGEDDDYTDIRRNGARRLRWMQLAEANRGKIDVELAKQMIADHRDVYLERDDHPSSRTICGHLEDDDARAGVSDHGPYNPWGANDGKVADSEMASRMSMWARWGRPCGRPFDVKSFLRRHPQWNWLDGYMRDRPSQPWVRFESTR